MDAAKVLAALESTVDKEYDRPRSHGGRLSWHNRTSPVPCMMKQSSFSGVEFASKKKLTRRKRFLAEIEAATPWPALVAALLRHYPKGDGRGRPPIGLERMLHIQSVCAFFGIDLTHESAPDATTLLKFRRLLDENELTRRIFDEIKGHLASKRLTMREGTIVDATLIAASPSLGHMRRIKAGVFRWRMASSSHIRHHQILELRPDGCTGALHGKNLLPDR